MEMIGIQEVIILLLVGFATGFINTVAGGGSLIVLPVLMFMGLPHTVANGTNRIGILVQSISGLAGFKSKSVTSFPIGMRQGLMAALGAIIGVKLALVINPKTFNYVLSVIMVIVVVLTVVNPKSKASDGVSYETGVRYWVSMFMFFFVGIYGGFIQAGLGFLSMAVSVFVNGFGIHRANHAKAFVTFCITVVAFLMFVFEGKMVWIYGILLAISSALGAWIASRWSVEKEEGTVKVILVVSVIVLAFRLVFPGVFDAMFEAVVLFFSQA